jgi:hypothetical protein
VVYNPELIPIINSKNHQVLSIVFSEYYPPTYSELNGLPNTGAIELKYDEIEPMKVKIKYYFLIWAMIMHIFFPLVMPKAA